MTTAELRMKTLLNYLSTKTIDRDVLYILLKPIEKDTGFIESMMIELMSLYEQGKTDE